MRALALVPFTASAPGLRARPLAWLRTALAVRRERARLARLDDAALADLGLSRAVVAAEACRPFWALPQARIC
jgi:uncharacterized protein YjiS (DUF1127 family)